MDLETISTTYLPLLLIVVLENTPDATDRWIAEFKFQETRNDEQVDFKRNSAFQQNASARIVQFNQTVLTMIFT